MNMNDIDNWMHASDDERAEVIQAWDVANAEGREVAKRVATLFKGECVYKVLETGVSMQDDKWVIEAFSETDDYEMLTKRKEMEFLGFSIVFRHIDDYSST